MSLSFFLFIYLLLSIFSPCLAGPQTDSFPFLPGIVPSCAAGCFDRFVTEHFSCPSQQDIICLCTSKGSSGFTLGEGALTCILAECIDVPERADQLNRAYAVCQSIAGSQPNTHDTIPAASVTMMPSVWRNNLMVPTASWTSTTILTSLISTSSVVAALSSNISPATFVDTGIVSATGSQSIPSTVYISSTRFDGVPTSTAITPLSTSTTTPSAVPAAATGISLTMPQIIGISVATGAGSFIIAGGLFVLLYHRRRKQQTKRGSISTFGGDQISSDREELRHEPFTPPQDSRPVHSPGREVSGKAQELLGVPIRRSEERLAYRKDTLDPHVIGLAVTGEPSPDITQEASPSSIQSYRTTSRLLPDMPSYSLFPSPPQLQQPMRSPPTRQHIDSPGLKLTPPSPSKSPTQRSWRQMNTSQVPMQGNSLSVQPLSSHAFPAIPNDPRAQMYAMERGRPWPQVPPIITSHSRHHPIIYRNKTPGESLSRAAKSSALMPLAFGPPLHQSHTPPTNAAQVSHPNAQSNYPSYTSQPSMFQPQISSLQHSRNTAYQSQKRNMRPATHYTSNSDTTIDEDDVEACRMSLPQRPEPPFVAGARSVPTPSGRFQYPPVPTSAVRRHPAYPVGGTNNPPFRQQSKQVWTSPAPVISPLTPTPTTILNVDKELPVLPRREPDLAERSDFPAAQHRGYVGREGPNSGRSPVRHDNEFRNTAKYQILCSPGLVGIEISGSPVQPPGKDAGRKIHDTVRGGGIPPYL